MDRRPRRPTAVLSNFFPINFKNPIIKYNIEVESPTPISPVQHQELVKKYVFKTKKNREFISSFLGAGFISLNGAIYSSCICSAPIDLESCEDDPDIKIKIVQDTMLDNAKDQDIIKNLVGRFFKLLLKKLRLKQIGRKLFDPSKNQTMDMFDVWPGFSTSLVFNANFSLLNIDFASKLITNINVLGLMENLKQRFSHEIESAFNKELIGKSVMTTYNRRFYKIDRVCFDKTPRSTFTLQDGEEITFADYYLKKYQKQISVLDQPLLINIDPKKSIETYLVPELCVMTGLNDEQRANRNLMTELDKIIKPDAGPRLTKSRALVESLQQNEFTKKFMDEWKLNLSVEPLRIEGLRIEAGSLLFGDKKSVDIENCQNLDRDTQHKSFVNKSFNILVIYYPRNCANEYKTFADMTRTVFQQFQIACNEIKPVEIPDFRSFDPVKQIIQQTLSPQVTACIWILPGPKKNGQHYDKIKRLLINNLPVPSQMIISKTIGAGKNLRSIITKLYVQVCAKIGGVPWAIDDLPFAERPTMVVGLDCYTKGTSKVPVYSMVATMNNTFSTYWSRSAFGSQEYPFSNFLAECFVSACEKFASDNKIAPANIIVFREGVSRGQVATVRETEVTAIRQAFTKVYGQGPQPAMVFVSTNKTSNAKFFYSPNNSMNLNTLQNPLQGTYVHQNITDDPNEFFLLAQKTFRGLASPTTFYIIENDMTNIQKVDMLLVKDLIAKLAFKLCFLYYNTTGAIKVPAPIHYAQKLSYLIGDKSVGNERIIPHGHLGQIQSLYFI